MDTQVEFTYELCFLRDQLDCLSFEIQFLSSLSGNFYPLIHLSKMFVNLHNMKYHVRTAHSVRQLDKHEVSF